jgi:hypothetical protein
LQGHDTVAQQPEPMPSLGTGQPINHATKRTLSRGFDWRESGLEAEHALPLVGVPWSWRKEGNAAAAPSNVSTGRSFRPPA